jgi:predicted amidohydrolase YtcJ
MSAAAELVMRNGKIITVDRPFSIAEAVAIGEGKIVHGASPARV